MRKRQPIKCEYRERARELPFNEYFEVEESALAGLDLSLLLMCLWLSEVLYKQAVIVIGGMIHDVIQQRQKTIKRE